VSWAVAAAGWAVVGALLLAARRRAGLLADAEHELRGATCVIGLTVERAARTGFTAGLASLVRLQLDRMRPALADLHAARVAPGRPAQPAERPLDAERLARVLANLLANAAEHGEGVVEVEASRGGGAMRLRLRNRNGSRPGGGPGRGRGVAIATRAADELGGRLVVDSEGGETVASLELPAPPPDDLGRAA
jgi:signal transduction histidine kinase